MGIVQRISDNLVNLVSGLGTSKDPTTASTWNLDLLNRNTQESAYRSNWLSRRIVDAPAEDAAREWRAWQAKDQEIEAIEEVEHKFDVQRKFRNVLIRARLYGGAALVMGVEQGESAEELDIEKVGKDDLKFVVVLNRYELNAGPRNYNVMSPYYTRPEFYTVSTPLHGFDVNPTAPVIDKGLVQIHPSRVLEFTGNELPDWRLAPMGGGWGDSVLQTCDEVLKDFGLTLGGIANMINDAKMDIVHIPDLSKNVTSKEYRDLLLTRFSSANQMKSTINSLVLDKEEEWERVSTRFQGLDGIMREIITVAAGAAGIPVSRLMGQAPGKGLSGSKGGGEQDMRNYYDTIAASQNTIYGPILEPLDRVIQRSALGVEDPSVHYEWRPLYQPDPNELADIALKKAQATQLDVSMGLINEDALRQARASQLTEDGTYPGLQDAIDEYGLEPVLPEPGEPGWKPTVDPSTGQTLIPKELKPAPPVEKESPPKKSDVKDALDRNFDELEARVRRLLNDFSPDKPRDKKGKWLKGEAAALADVNPNHDRLGRFATSPGVHETTDAARFIQSRDQSSRAKFMSPLVPDDLKDHHLFLSPDGAVGYAMSPDGDLQNLFSNSPVKGAGRAALVDAIKNGAMTLDAYDGHLTALYSSYGFRAVSRIAFDPRFAPDGWHDDKDLKYRPDIVFMIYDGGPRGSIEKRIGKFPLYDKQTVELHPDYDSAKAAQGRARLAVGTVRAGKTGDGKPDKARRARDLHSQLDGLPRPVPSGKGLLGDFNSNHEPAGTSKGGEFASAEGGGVSISPELQAKMDAAEKEAAAIPATFTDNSPARLALRQHIEDTIYNAELDRRPHNKEATIILGLPGAGKSTLADPLLKSGALEIDPDIAKTMIPEYRNGIGSNAVHEESSMITRGVLRRALTNGDDIVWPRIDGGQKFIRDVQNLTTLGYKVHVKLIDVSQKESIQSVVDRFEKTGRYVPLETVKEFGTQPSDSYNEMKKLGIAASMERYKRKIGGGFDHVD